MLLAAFPSWIAHAPQPRQTMIERLLLFGATGDLAGRFLLPALAELCASGQLPDAFEVVGAARQELSDQAYRDAAGKRLARHAPDVPVSAREDLLRRLRYRPIDLASDRLPDAIRDLLAGTAEGESRPAAVYLALPPRLFSPAVAALGAAGLPPGSRIVLEKPFGESLEDAVALNRLLAEVTAAAGEAAVFRVDHVLGMATVYNLLGVRLANRVLEPLWNGTHIEEVEILWEETLALEGRAGYYDGTGALKDVMQNHMLQILSLVAMEPPASLAERDLRDRKVDALRTVRPPAEEQMARRTRRARYTSGRLASTGGADGREVPDYVTEEGVDPDGGTETFAEVVLELGSRRWAGTRFVLRAGKALDRTWKGVILRFRPAPNLPLDEHTPAPHRNELRIGLDGPETLSLHLTGSAPGPPVELVPLALTARLPAAELRAYSQVLLDVLSGDCTLSIRGDEAEEAWRIMTPVLRAWAESRVPLEEYPAGSAGPPERSGDGESSGRPA
jgi:glucose-6-phosphate 1-dehydrogenase